MDCKDNGKSPKRKASPLLSPKYRLFSPKTKFTAISRTPNWWGARPVWANLGSNAKHATASNDLSKNSGEKNSKKLFSSPADLAATAKWMRMKLLRIGWLAWKSNGWISGLWSSLWSLSFVWNICLFSSPKKRTGCLKKATCLGLV